MPLPTWRNVPTANISGAAAFGRNAIGFNDQVARGATELSDFFQERIDEENRQLTNTAIADQLAGRSVTFDPRVDQEDFNRITTNVEGHRDDLLTAAVNRRGNTAIAEDQEYLNTEGQRELRNNLTQSEIDARKATALHQSAQRDKWAADARTAEEAAQEATKLDDQGDSIDRKTWEIREAYRQSRLAAGDSVQQAGEAADDFAYGAEGREVIQRFSHNAGHDPDAMANSRWGQLDDVASQVADGIQALDTARTEERNKIDQEGRLFLSRGDPTRLYVDPETGERRFVSKEEATADSAGSTDEAVGRLEFYGLNANAFKQDGPARDTLERARKILKNGSLLASSMRGFIVDGEFDAAGYERALGTNLNNMRWDLINQKRQEQGLRGIAVNFGGEPTATGGGGGGGENLTPAERIKAAVTGGTATREDIAKSSVSPEEKVKLSQEHARIAHKNSKDALNQIRDIPKSVRDDPRTDKILSKFEEIFDKGTLTRPHPAFTSRKVTKTYTPDELNDELENFSEYMNRLAISQERQRALRQGKADKESVEQASVDALKDLFNN